jgi:release factor glutamine methyltransferase
MLKLLDLLNTTTDFLAKKGVPSPRLQTELMLGHALGLSRMQLYLQFERDLTPAELDLLRPMVKRRSQREPLQHILGETGFLELTVASTPAALIPRPETEVLADWVAADLKEKPPGTLADVGTGTGIIALSMATALPGWKILGLDVSPGALELAKANGARYPDAPVEWRISDLLSAVPEPLDVVVANLPYIATSELAAVEPEVKADPVLALDGGVDGLDVVRRLVAQASGKVKSVYLEVGHAHRDAVTALFKASGFPHVEVRADLNGVERFLLGRTES